MKCSSEGSREEKGLSRANFSSCKLCDLKTKKHLKLITVE